MPSTVLGKLVDGFKSINNGETVDSSLHSAKASSMVAEDNIEYKKRRDERRPFELQWRLNIAFMDGIQYMDINSNSQSVEEIPKLFWWQEREVFNHVAPNVEVRISKLGRIKPILVARPSSGEVDDIRSAKITSALMKNVFYDDNIQGKMLECYAWDEVCGSVLLKHTWNSSRGKLLGMTQTPNEETGEVSQQEVKEGDIEDIICPAQEILPDSTFRQNVRDCRSIMHCKAFHIDEIEEYWGKRVTAEDSDALQLQRTMFGSGGLGYAGNSFNWTSMKLKDHALVKELWIAPCKKYPQGALRISAGGQLLAFGNLPYKVGADGVPALPFSKLDCIKRPGIFWGKTVVERMIPIQRRYNALRNRKAEYLNRVAIGQYNIEVDSLENEHDVEMNAGAPGQCFYYNRGSNPPQRVQSEGLPNAFETEENTLLQEFSILSGVSELSRQSSAPTGVKSGVALQVAQEQDETRLSSTASNITDFVVDSGKQWMRLFKQFSDFQRTLRTIGDNSLVDVIDYTGSELETEDIIIDGNSASIESPAQRKQTVFDLLSAGLFNDPDTGRMSKEGRLKIFEMINLGNWESGDDSDKLHYNKAERENKAMEAGNMAVAVPYDDHLIHISRHNSYRLTVEYEQLMGQNPQVDMMFQQHVNMHLMNIMPQVTKGGEGQEAEDQEQDGK